MSDYDELHFRLGCVAYYNPGGLWIILWITDLGFGTAERETSENPSTMQGWL